MGNAAAPAPKANMGEPMVRLDPRLKVSGEARYPRRFSGQQPGFCLPRHERDRTRPH